MTVDVERQQVLAYRIAAQGLHRETGDPAELETFELGFQDTPTGSAQQAVAARLSEVPQAELAGTRPFTLLWAVRGAPHLHRAGGLSNLAAALWPLSDEDAAARMGALGPHLKRVGVPERIALSKTATAFRASVSVPMTKGEASAAITERIPEELSSWCRGCQARHVNDQLMRLAALPAGIRIEPGSAPLTFHRIARWPGVPSKPAGTEALVESYLRLLGPATESDVAGYLGTRGPEVRPVWPEDLIEVRVDGRKTRLPEDRIDALFGAERTGLVRLLPPYDPYLQARDRALLLPDKAQRSSLWRGLPVRRGRCSSTTRSPASGEPRRVARAASISPSTRSRSLRPAPRSP